jgi:hypothetical protein
MSQAKMLRNGLFAAVTATALGFGATQAFAVPSGGATARACSTQQHAWCDQWCRSRGFDGGECNPLYQGDCRCWFI